MDQTTFTALVALGTAIATGIGVKFFDFLTVYWKSRKDLDSKKFDDGVLRRQELLKEIESLKATIEKREGEISRLNTVLEKIRDEFLNLSIKYTQLQGDYKDAVEKLDELKGKINTKIDETKKEIIDNNHQP